MHVFVSCKKWLRNPGKNRLSVVSKRSLFHVNTHFWCMSARPFWARKPFKKQCVGKRPKSSIKRGVCGASKPFKKQAFRKRRKATNKTKILLVKNIRLMQVFRLKKIRQTATQILIYKCLVAGCSEASFGCTFLALCV